MRTLDDEDVLALVQSGARKFEWQIRHRDWREAIAAIIAGALIAPAGFRGSFLVRIGAWITLGGLALVIWRLNRARRLGGPGATDLSLPVAEALRAERLRLDAQIELLESVWWWYVAPLSVGMVLLTAGARGLSWFTLAYSLIVGLMAWGIVALNLRAVRRDLGPRRNEIAALLVELGE